MEKDDYIEVDSVAQLKEIVETKRETDAQLEQERRGNRSQRRRFKLLWRAVQEGKTNNFGVQACHYYTKHQPTRAEIKARRKK